MRTTLCYSTMMLSIAILLGLPSALHAQTYAVDDPMILTCPDSYKGEMTVVETNKKPNPWQILKWNCQGLQGLVDKTLLEKYLLQNPPSKTQARRWEERCPSGSVGNIVFNSHEGRRFVESWTCSIDGASKMVFEDLKRMLETKQTLEGVSGVKQQRTCPSPYQGIYSMEYRGNKWELAHWTCTAPGSNNRVLEATMRMLLPQQ